jgi:ketosteroid isomerase-like protein
MRMASRPCLELKLSLNERSGLTEEAGHNRELVVKAYEARLTGDAQALLRLLDPKIEFHLPKSLPYGGAYSGPDGVIKGIERLFAFWGQLEIDFEDFLAAGDLVIGYFHVKGAAATGKTYANPGCVLFRFKDGKIVEWRTFEADTHLIRELCAVS